MTHAIAVDLGGTKIEACLVDADGSIVPASRSRRATGAAIDASGLRAAIADVVSGALAAIPAGASVTGVGIGSAGPVDTARGTVAPLNLAAARDFPVVAAVQGALPSPLREQRVAFALDGQCIAIAEHWKGAGTGVDTMLGMVVSTGIGGGIVTGGRPVAGGTGNAGHIGQVEVADFAGEGVRGLEATVERVASGPNIVRWARSRGWAGQTGEDLAAGYAAGDALAIAAVRRSAAAVGSALASASALLDLDLVVIGGGFSHVSPDYVELVRAARDAVAAYPFLARADIVRASLGGDAPLIGAAALVLRD
jgi:glucokinase